MKKWEDRVGERMLDRRTIKIEIRHGALAKADSGKTDIVVLPVAKGLFPMKTLWHAGRLPICSHRATERNTMK